jgi:hypothetical protein
MNSISSPVIFTDINTFTNNKLTVDGNTPFGNPSIEKLPKERNWLLKDQAGRIFYISYLGLSLAGHFQFLLYRFSPSGAKKRYRITIKYHAAAG